MILYQYPVGKPYFAKDLQEVKDNINACNWNFPLGMIECDIVQNPNAIFTTIATHSDEGQLVYDGKPHRVNKTTIDLMDDVKYNGMTVVNVYVAELWAEKMFLFREAISEMFNERVDAKDTNQALAEALKLMMNGCGGKLGQAMIDIQNVISEDLQEIDNYYRKGQVLSDRRMANGKQYLLTIHKRRTSKIEIPSHLYAFILSYGRHHVNLCVNAIDGFKDWGKITYADTDSIFTHHREYLVLENKQLPDECEIPYQCFLKEHKSKLNDSILKKRKPPSGKR